MSKCRDCEYELRAGIDRCIFHVGPAGAEHIKNVLSGGGCPDFKKATTIKPPYLIKGTD